MKNTVILLNLGDNVPHLFSSNIKKNVKVVQKIFARFTISHIKINAMKFNKISKIFDKAMMKKLKRKFTFSKINFS